MSQAPHRYFIINKPYNMVSQFISPDNVGLLGDINFVFPEGTHAIGRLDNLSEGLLILTTNKKVTALLFQGAVPHARTYLVRVNHEVTAENVKKLRSGVSIRIKGGEFYTTPPCDVQVIKDPPYLMDYQKETVKQIKHTWLLITLKEGKFHQVRKMVAAIHHRCRRLIRVSIEGLELGNLAPGCVREIEEKEFFSKLNISNWEK